ncbi:MAG TPA: SCO family protein [Bacteroidota bacterium]|nr:SCO family protein [Bacteroidota bacterium]
MSIVEQPKKFRTLSFAALFVLAAGIAGLQLWQKTRITESSLPRLGALPAFSLTAHDSSKFSERDFATKVTITDFIFTTCAGPCPLMSAQMQHLQETLHENPSVQFVSFSVDPETDTPGVLTEYAVRFGAIPGKWKFLTGPKKEIYDIIRDGFHLAIADDENAIAHSTKFVVVDKKGQIRGYYDSEDEGSMKKLLEDVHSLL